METTQGSSSESAQVSNTNHEFTLARYPGQLDPPWDPNVVFVGCDDEVFSTVGKHAIVGMWEAGDPGRRPVDYIIAEARNLGVSEALIVPVRRGLSRTSTTNKVTIIVAIEPGVVEQQLAQEVATSCYLILARMGLGDVTVEIIQVLSIPAQIHRLGERFQPPWEDDYGINPPLGRSIGVSGRTGAGTLGFYVRVTRVCPESGTKPEPEYFGVTCHHILADQDKLEASIRADGTAPRLTVECPSPDDHKTWMHQLSVELDETIDSRDTLRQRREFAEVDATVPFTQDHQDYLATTEQKVDVLRTQLAATQSRCVGTVVLTSGVVVENNRLRDWVLISLDKARFPDTQRVTNRWPKHCIAAGMLAGDKPFHRRDLFNKRLTAAINDDCPDEDTKQWAARYLVDGKFNVYKLGRTSGVTKAELNPLCGQQITYGSRAGGLQTVTASVLVAVDLASLIMPFAQEGDSGSLVVDRFGAAVGVVVGAGSRCRNPLYTTSIVPIEEVVEDIERRLGEFWGADVKVEIV